MRDTGSPNERPQEEEISCRELVQFLSSYLDGDLEAPRREVFDAHLRACDDCAAYLSSFRQTIRLTHLCTADDPDLPADAPEDLVRAVVAALRAK